MVDPLANKVKSVHAAGQFSFAVKKSGSVYSWGSNSKGQLGHPMSTDNVIALPKKV